MKGLLLVVIFLAGCQAAMTPAASGQASGKTAIDPFHPRHSGLKYKGRGPACMCAGGLSEEDILEQQLVPDKKQDTSP